MIVIRRLVDRRRAYTGIFLKGEAPRIFPTSEQEHARILQIFKQDRAHLDVENDFTDYALGKDRLSASAAARSMHAAREKPPIPLVEKIEPAAHGPRRDENDSSLWLTISEDNRDVS
ncbi:MAG: hypothetical protein ABIZ81_03630 [Opitutaceae bacterium]